jgi:hypothetical protein
MSVGAIQRDAQPRACFVRDCMERQQRLAQPPVTARRNLVERTASGLLDCDPLLPHQIGSSSLIDSPDADCHTDASVGSSTRP